MNRFAKLLQTAPWTARIGLLIIFGYLILFLFAPWIAPYSETEIVSDAYMPWDNQFIFGTDNIGRDMLSRLIYGARNTIGIALITTALAFIGGVIIGFLAATVGGWLDQFFSRLNDILMAIPGIIFALLTLTLFGSSIGVVIVVIAVVEGTRVFRLSRAVGQSIVVLDFIEAARLRGEGLAWITVREILPNALPPLAAEFGLRFCFVFLFLAALNFLGLGIQPPTADWGSMVKENATLISYGDITPLLPAGAIALLTVGVNFVVDWFLHKTAGLRDDH